MTILEDASESMRTFVRELKRNPEVAKGFSIAMAGLMTLVGCGVIAGSYIDKARELGSYSAVNQAICDYVHNLPNLPAVDPRCYTFSLDDQVER
ncbi:MAG: hypothetical protein WCI72_03505 [archaeon]